MGDQQVPVPSVPVSMLSGFLGAGKTTLLRHILQNTELKIGCIVNDVASVNIDAKLIRNDTRQRDPSKPASTADLTDTIELANGCACCSIADELFDSFENLLKVAQRRGIQYDRIVLENSGVAEPQNIRDQFNEAIALGHPLTRRVHLDTLITVVDAATFIKDFSSKGPIASRPELGEGGGMRPVVDLLVEQVECADFIVLNKIDMLDDHTLDSLSAIVSSLNPLARVVKCQWGEVPVGQVLGPEVKGLVAQLNVEGQHRAAMAAAKEQHEDGEGEGEDGCAECAADGGDHDHDHHHDHKHDHHHDHDHKHNHNEKEEDCKACAAGEPHDHHNHKEHKNKKPKNGRQATTAAARFGILSFVYRRRRPFHPQRLKDLVLRWMPVSHNKALSSEDVAAPASEASPIRTVLRSKGFMWLSNSHTTAFYWSHAGQHFEIRDEGEWWAAVPDDEWPQHPGQRTALLADFDTSEGGWGDRRQEIVFIGAGMDQEAIAEQLDGALLTDAEIEQYKEQYKYQHDPEHQI